MRHLAGGVAGAPAHRRRVRAGDDEMRVRRLSLLNGASRAAHSLTLLLVGGCVQESEPPRPNVVLIVVDTLRADRLPFYGSPVNTAPFLDRLAQRSVVFENAWSPSSWTLPATVSVLTSVHPFQHGVNSLEGLERRPDEDPLPVNAIPEEIETLAEVLAAAGYRTYGIASNVLVGEEVGFERGFDRFVRLQDEDADVVNARVEDWRSEMLDNSPFFLYLHYFDPHDPFHAREPWFGIATTSADSGWPERLSVEGADAEADLDWIMTQLEPMPEGFLPKKARDLSPAEISRLLGWIRAAYDSEIGFVDSRIREIFEKLELEEAIVFFLADHGEEFYEHGDLTHGQNLYGESMRVPLLMYLPHDGAPRGRVKSHVSTLDVVPTVRRLLQLPASAQDEGQDLLGDAPRPPVVGFLQGKSGQHPLENDLRSIVVADHRVIAAEDGRAQLFDLAHDPLERTDLSDEFPAVTAELLRELDSVETSAPRFPRAFRVPQHVSPEILEHLKGLGYIGK